MAHVTYLIKVSVTVAFTQRLARKRKPRLTRLSFYEAPLGHQWVTLQPAALSRMIKQHEGLVPCYAPNKPS